MINYGFFTKNTAKNQKYFAKSTFIDLNFLITLIKARERRCFFDSFSGP